MCICPIVLRSHKVVTRFEARNRGEHFAEVLRGALPPHKVGVLLSHRVSLSLILSLTGRTGVLRAAPLNQIALFVFVVLVKNLLGTKICHCG